MISQKIKNLYSPRNRTSWDKYMLKDISKYNFYGRSQFVRLRGKYTAQCTHCAMFQSSMSQCFNVPMFKYSIGPLVHWSIGPLVHWSIGPLVHWSNLKSFARSSVPRQKSKSPPKPYKSSQDHARPLI